MCNANMPILIFVTNTYYMRVFNSIKSIFFSNDILKIVNSIFFASAMGVLVLGFNASQASTLAEAQKSKKKFLQTC